MSATANLQPPRRGVRNGGDEWVRLVTLAHRHEAEDLVERLEAEAIDTYVIAVPRSKTGAIVSVASSVVILVRRRQLDEARFLLAMVAFERPAAPSRPLSMRVAGALVAGLMSLLLLSAAILQPDPPGAMSCERGNLGGSTFRGLVIPCRVPEPAP